MRTNGCRVESSFTALVQRMLYYPREPRVVIRASHMEAWSPSQGRRAGRQLVLPDSVFGRNLTVVRSDTKHDQVLHDQV